MSTDWNVHCIDCDDTHGFDDANHCSEEMAVLCHNAAEIAALLPMMEQLADRARHGFVKLSTAYGDVDVSWFAKHAGHRLCPISEYGDLLRAPIR